MNAIEIIFYVMAGLSLVIALLLSGSGSSNGLNSMAATDLEIFKKTKDRGVTKVLQIILFIIVFVLITLAIIYRFLIK
ncbi:MAG: preprotein translocase subunit SecG [Mycoplasmoidaceae bacterium]